MTSELIESFREIVDTNILIYAHDPTDAEKQNCAVELIQALTDRKVLTVTVQVLNEFYVRSTNACHSEIGHKENTISVRIHSFLSQAKCSGSGNLSIRNRRDFSKRD